MIQQWKILFGTIALVSMCACIGQTEPELALTPSEALQFERNFAVVSTTFSGDVIIDCTIFFKNVSSTTLEKVVFKDFKTPEDLDLENYYYGPFYASDTMYFETAEMQPGEEREYKFRIIALGAGFSDKEQWWEFSCSVRIEKGSTYTEETYTIRFGLTPSPPATSAPPNTLSPSPPLKPIEIYTVHYDALGDDRYNPNGEWVEIRNIGNQEVDMSGWRLYDDAYKQGKARDHVFTFPPGFILRAGQTVTIYTGKGISTGSKLYFGRASGEYAAIWNNDSDCAYLVDNRGNPVDEYCWGKT
jgi:hypothetical protein